jgi:hypothetical protein
VSARSTNIFVTPGWCGQWMVEITVDDGGTEIDSMTSVFPTQAEAWRDVAMMLGNMDEEWFKETK